MLLGEFQCAADKRLAIPAELASALGEGVTITRGIDRCLFIYPAGEWLRLVEKMQRQLSLTNRDARAFARLMFSGALTCTPNQEGQIPLPSDLRQYAGIEDEAIVVGLCTHLEVWNPQRWQEVNDQTAKEGAAVAERLAHLEI
ncbi:MAG: division/cell wall cluster transcriptional repressor MraZ [Anaerolineae bacterium]|nr:division/cell wall cluster transcriptional repressor MraZ [Anaerolineae bacterium]